MSIAKHKERNLRHRYGLTLKEFKQLCRSQGLKCFICKRKRKLCVDHCHATGKVRGMLCLQCNTFVGYVEREGSLLPVIKRYLEVDHA